MSMRKTTKLLFAVVLILVAVSPVCFAADAPENRTVLTVGSTTLSETDVLRLLSGDGEGNEMMVMLMLSQSALPERLEMVGQMVDFFVLAEAAKDEKVDESADVAFQIKLQVAQILVQSYFDKISEKWDFSREAALKYYNKHPETFVLAEAVQAAHILAETESDALLAAMEAMTADDFGAVAQKYSRDPNTAQNGGDLGWVVKGQLPQPLEDVIMKGRPGQIVGPVESEAGWHVVKVGERRAAKQMTFEESSGVVYQNMQNEYLERDLAKLKEKYKVSINEEVLSTLGGLPAPAPAQ